MSLYRFRDGYGTVRVGELVDKTTPTSYLFSINGQRMHGTPLEELKGGVPDPPGKLVFSYALVASKERESTLAIYLWRGKHLLYLKAKATGYKWNVVARAEGDESGIKLLKAWVDGYNKGRDRGY